ncbi:VIT1/CCC1 family predicted Fe2+/Mn2+ transporter [Friedmanniella endophytica]|uniref:VIT1/CCC1 family predicted Fe2+/Mn2+ transporter n=1 Tax=Microlunatus kandeliicorticis TaxID=1759536 RepID=A0A7W3IPM6_9ACTN|nr:hypothetical protein [Microlunatus kandeliicorticis]MBA8792921.1 VIT1/CCC1 family predicted Fe2+/Mn2+ transporter [Microlunatus kandeliicorticis]
MSGLRGSWRQQYLLPLSLGLADGIVNALTLASASVLHGRGLGVSLGLKVGAVALVSAVFTIFVAEYAQLRSELTRAEHELSLTRSGRLAAGSLGRQVLREALTAAGVGCLASFVGAVTPLLVGALLAPYSWTALLVSVLGLGGLGAGLAVSVHGRVWRWVTSMTLMGAVVAYIGVLLNIA